MAWMEQQPCYTTHYTHNYQSTLLTTSPRPLSSKYSFERVKIIQIQYIL